MIAAARRAFGIRDSWALRLVALFAFTLAVRGPVCVDAEDFLCIGASPWRLLASHDREFLYSSPVNFVLANALALVSLRGYLAIHVFEIVLMLALVAWSIRRKIAPGHRALFATLLALTPLWLVIVTWIGKTDPLLVGFVAACWATRSRWRVVFAVVTVAAHRELGSAMCLALWALEDRRDRRLLAAVVAGNLLHLGYQYGILDAVPETRAELLVANARGYLEGFLRAPIVYVACTLSWYWLVVSWHPPSRKVWAALALAFLLAVPIADFTRGFALAALPAVLVHLESAVRTPECSTRRWLAVLAPLQLQIVSGHVALAGNRWRAVLETWTHG